jgi:hypothetical protein
VFQSPYDGIVESVLRIFDGVSLETKNLFGQVGISGPVDTDTGTQAASAVVEKVRSVVVGDEDSRFESDSLEKRISIGIGDGGDSHGIFGTLGMKEHGAAFVGIGELHSGKEGDAMDSRKSPGTQAVDAAEPPVDGALKHFEMVAETLFDENLFALGL